ncbi:acyl-CoA dehydrogenase family protein [Pseudoramibacter sp. HA2172]|uniref:acyl-CoA dehydrogenase family protein n=1 Tax=Pseudoramibacter faecis TaxID=3108534 RepID=UPI002E7A4AAA|nr:acyl-CoA dehydrogenase family protein [Pseudoramibacter sp. HA2172]
MIPTQEQMDVANAVRDYLETEVKSVAADYDASGEIPTQLYDGMAEMGLNIMCVPEEAGGLGLSSVTQTLIAEQMGRYEVGLGSAVGANASATHLINNAASAEQKEIFYGGLTAGGWAAFALTEADSGSDASSISTTVEADGDELIINGSKCFITNGGIASVYVVMATADKSLGGKGIGCYLVEREREGIKIGKEEDKMGIRLSNTTEVIFDNVRIPKDHEIAGPGKGFKIALSTLTESRVNVGAMGVGLAARALDEAVAYAKVRKQFGKPIGKLQAIGFMLADIATQVEAGRQLALHTAELIDAGKPFMAAASMTKCFGSDTAMQCTIDALQVLGGYGYMREYPMEKMVRDAKILQIYEGTNQIQRVIIGNQLLR